MFRPVSAEPVLRVAIEATSLLGPRTGVGVVTDNLLRRLATTDGIDLTALLVSWRGRGELAAQLPDGVAEDAVVFPARLAHLLWQHIDRPSVNGYDVVHGANFVVPPSPGAAELVTIHDFGPWHYPELVTDHARAFPRLVERAVRRGADVHVSCEFLAGEARDILALADDRIHVISFGFEGAVGDPARGRRLAGGDRYVLAVGTIEPRKDLPTLVAAMAELWPNHRDVRLVVAGGNGWGTEDFEEALRRVQPVTPEGAVVRLGFVSDTDRSDLLAGAGCLAFPSLYEGYGLPPLEAMAQGCPVVTTTAGSIPEVCGDAAWFVAPGDADALAEAIDAVLTDATVSADLIAAGRSRLTRFSWDATGQDMAALYRDLAIHGANHPRR